MAIFMLGNHTYCQMRLAIILFLLLSGGLIWAQSGKLSTRLETPRSMGHDTHHGLKGTYSQGRWIKTQVFSRIDPQVNFDWGLESPDPRLEAEHFWVTWEGSLYTPRAGTYTFTINSDEGARLWVRDELLIDQWDTEGHGTHSASLSLQANTLYALRLEYHNRSEEAFIRLYWRFETEPSTVISERFLFSSLPEEEQEQEPGIMDKFLALFGWGETEAQPRDSASVSPHANSTPAASPAPRTLMAEGPKLAPAVVPTLSAAKPGAGPDTAFRPAAGTIIPLKEIHFEKSRYELVDTAYPELDRLAAALLAYPEIEIEVAGHTDFHPQSDPDRNLKLSYYRALTVATYLQAKGVAEDRIAVKGYGGTEPIASNEVPEGRAQNRRVEIRVKEE